MTLRLFVLLTSVLTHCIAVTAFQSPSLYRSNMRNGVLREDLTHLDAHTESGVRRVFLESLFLGSSISFLASSPPANALVKGKFDCLLFGQEYACIDSCLDMTF